MDQATPEDGGATRQKTFESLDDFVAQASSFCPSAFTWEEIRNSSFEPCGLESVALAQSTP